MLSYRYPIPWDKKWDYTLVGFRASSGSLSQKTLLHTDEVRIDPSPDSRLSLSFSQLRRESVDEALLDREVKLSYGLGHFRFGILGDGGTEKEFGDLGASINYKPSADMDVTVYYWSTDHYYSEKVAEEYAKQTRSTYSAGTSGRGALGSLRWHFSYEFDHPLRWVRPLAGYIYDYQRQEGRLGLSTDGDEGFYTKLRYLQKSEGFQPEFSIIDSQTVIIDMSRQVMEGEVGFNQTEGAIHRNIGVIGIAREYEFRGEPYTGAFEEKVNRREWGLVFSQYEPFWGSADIRCQWGTQINTVRLRQNGLVQRTEIKLQFAFDVTLNKSSFLFFNTTWDIDELYRNFPYGDKPFKPWGGGNVQFIMTI